jgi:hypothetical protein
MPLGIYLTSSQGRKSATLPTHFTLKDFRKLIEKKIGNPEHFDYSLGDVIFRTWNEEVFNRQRSAIHDGVTIIIEYPPIGSNAAAWRQPIAGLCLEGVCLHIDCQAFERKVIINCGTGKFTVIDDSIVVASTCPICHLSVQPTFCAFYRCSWRITGVQQQLEQTSTTPSTTIDEEWHVATDDYHRLSEKFSSWSQLTIETKLN